VRTVADDEHKPGIKFPTLMKASVKFTVEYLKSRGEYAIPLNREDVFRFASMSHITRWRVLNNNLTRRLDTREMQNPRH
jgi:hypothetical protein